LAPALELVSELVPVLGQEPVREQVLALVPGRVQELVWVQV